MSAARLRDAKIGYTGLAARADNVEVRITRIPICRLR